MPYVLNVLYLLLLLAAAPWLLVAAVRKGKYRAGWREKLLGLVPISAPGADCVWLHAVSLGEVSLIGPLVAEFEQRRPGRAIVISTTTATGYAAALKRYPRHTVFYAPLDFSWAVRRTVARVRPRLLVLAELELWPNLIAAARASGARVAVVNGRLSERSFRGYRRVRPLVRSMLAGLDLIAVQNAAYAARFRELGAPAERLHVTGSLKFDGAATDRDNPATARLRKLAGFAPDDTVFLAGSTQAPEERLALDAFSSLAGEFPRLRLVLVPRHPERFEEVAALLAVSGLAWQRRTQLELDSKPAGDCPDFPVPWEENGTVPLSDARVLLVDTVGELGAWWGTATIAYVGGSIGPNGQNMIEPAAYGAAVSFGPRTRNFRDVVEALLTAEAAVVVRDGRELTAFVRRCLAEPRFAEQQGAHARRVVAGQLGAAHRTADLLDSLIEPETASGQRTAA